MSKKPQFYVAAITEKKVAIGYGVYDCIGGMVSRHAEFMGANAKAQADKACAEMNATIEVCDWSIDGRPFA